MPSDPTGPAVYVGSNGAMMQVNLASGEGATLPAEGFPAWLELRAGDLVIVAGQQPRCTPAMVVKNVRDEGRKTIEVPMAGGGSRLVYQHGRKVEG